MENNYNINSRIADYIESHRAAHQKNYCRVLMKEPRKLTDEDCKKFLDAAQFLNRGSGQWNSDRTQIALFLEIPRNGSSYSHQWHQLSHLLGMPGKPDADGNYEKPSFD